MADNASIAVPDEGKRPGRVLYYDVLNVAACFAVLMLHFNGLAHAWSPTFAWRQALSAECLFYWAVPVFFMLSGATLMRYRERYDTRTFLRKRLVRTAVPFVAWSVGALVWKVATGQMPMPQGPRTVLNLVMNTQILDIYWFFIPLFAIYLCMPVLSLLADGRHDRVLWYAVGVAFLTTSLLPGTLPLVGIQWNPALSLPVLSGYLMFPVLGYLLSRTELTRRQRVACYLLGMFGLVLRYVATVVLSDARGAVDETFWGYTNFPSVFLAVAVFVFAKQVDWARVFSTPRRVSALAKVAGCSFGVYLSHMILFYYMLEVTGLNGGRLLWATVCPLVAYAICLGITWVLKRAPVVRRLVP